MQHVLGNYATRYTHEYAPLLLFSSSEPTIVFAATSVNKLNTEP